MPISLETKIEEIYLLLRVLDKKMDQILAMLKKHDDDRAYKVSLGK